MDPMAMGYTPWKIFQWEISHGKSKFFFINHGEMESHPTLLVGNPKMMGTAKPLPESQLFLITLRTLSETNSSPLKMDGWKTIVSFRGPAYFQVRAVSFREGNLSTSLSLYKMPSFSEKVDRWWL